MKVHHPNFSRQVLKQFANPELAWDARQKTLQPSVRQLLPSAVKFMLPEGGRLLDDMHYKALDDNEPLRLPYPVIALEYIAPFDANFPRRIALAVDDEAGDGIFIMPLICHQQTNTWGCFPPARIPRTGYLARDKATKAGVPVMMRMAKEFSDDEYANEVGAVMCLLNALQCSNVRIEKQQARAKGKKKDALPFDDYHILTIEVAGSPAGAAQGGTHRSPREHLRRGHIRRLPDRKIWVNAAVIGAGRGAGKITKDYAVT